MKKSNFPLKGYISKRMFATITAFLDMKGYMTKIAKTKRVNNYFVYVNGQIQGRTSRTRMAAKRKIYKLFVRIVNSKT